MGKVGMGVKGWGTKVGEMGTEHKEEKKVMGMQNPVQPIQKPRSWKVGNNV